MITVSTRGLLKQAVSGRAVVKSLSGNGEKEHGGTAKSLRVGISVAVAYLGGVAGSSCSAVVHSRDAV